MQLYLVFIFIHFLSYKINYFFRNTNVYQLATLAGVQGRVEVEKQFINKKLKTVTAYYGELCKSDEITN